MPISVVCSGADNPSPAATSLPIRRGRTARTEGMSGEGLLNHYRCKANALCFASRDVLHRSIALQSLQGQARDHVGPITTH